MLQYYENQSSGTLRLDLQGLRAIAVTVVFLAHAGVQGFSGGYIGVDLFFVLSGFLITGVLYKEFEATGSVNIFAFYSRRIKRLLPAMALVIGLTLAISFVLLPGFQAKAQIGSSPFASLWLSNFYFTFSELDYFNELGEKDLFLHTWSLAVEEQFYLVWPFLLLFLARFRQRRVSEKHNLRIRLAVGLLLVLGLSFALSLYWIEESPLLAFYHMPSRAWQFALGALVFLAVYRTPFRTNESCGTAKGLSLLIVGAGAIAASTWFYDDQMTYPGWAAVVPSVGAALVI
ncbi:MAG: acyltransferase, partial [Marinobacter sp.]|nr:acyltransferase [Marinobacter sp.]